MQVDVAERLTQAEVEAMGDEELRAVALGWVNDVRTEYGAKPVESLPKGMPRDPGSCVLAEATRDLHSGEWPEDMRGGGRYAEPSEEEQAALDAGAAPNGTMRIMRDGEMHTRPIPPVVTEFMWRFDGGQYPDLTSAPLPTISLSDLRIGP